MYVPPEALTISNALLNLNPFDKINDPPSTFQLVHVRFSPDIDLNYQVFIFILVFILLHII